MVSKLVIIPTGSPLSTITTTKLPFNSNKSNIRFSELKHTNASPVNSESILLSFPNNNSLKIALRCNTFLVSNSSFTIINSFPTN